MKRTCSPSCLPLMRGHELQAECLFSKRNLLNSDGCAFFFLTSQTGEERARGNPSWSPFVHQFLKCDSWQKLAARDQDAAGSAHCCLAAGPHPQTHFFAYLLYWCIWPRWLKVKRASSSDPFSSRQLKRLQSDLGCGIAARSFSSRSFRDLTVLFFCFLLFHNLKQMTLAAARNAAVFPG